MRLGLTTDEIRFYDKGQPETYGKYVRPRAVLEYPLIEVRILVSQVREMPVVMSKESRKRWPTEAVLSAPCLVKPTRVLSPAKGPITSSLGPITHEGRRYISYGVSSLSLDDDLTN